MNPNQEFVKGALRIAARELGKIVYEGFDPDRFKERMDALQAVNKALQTLEALESLEEEE